MPETPASFAASPITPDRIVFPGSPWPGGHAIAAFCWSARIDPSSGLWFDLHLKSADYDAEDRSEKVDAEEDDSLPNWKSRIVWLNYHACILSSTYWDNGGFNVSSGETPFEFDSLDGREFTVDPLPIDDDDLPAFGIYLQGHDTTADHRIAFSRSEAKDRWSVSWRGRVALTYLGDDRFIHEFNALAGEAAFDGIAMPSGTSGEEAKRLLARFVAGPGRFVLEERDGCPYFRFA